MIGKRLLNLALGLFVLCIGTIISYASIKLFYFVPAPTDLTKSVGVVESYEVESYRVKIKLRGIDNAYYYLNILGNKENLVSSMKTNNLKVIELLHYDLNLDLINYFSKDSIIAIYQVSVDGNEIQSFESAITSIDRNKYCFYIVSFFVVLYGLYTISKFSRLWEVNKGAE
ncbi:hypothetical protein [Alteromonas australica]|uniref:Uncharacterized protein n=1 Tax=Alteromonas australica TaxID=589873 RepID=A0A075NWR9_9ALTE|nr:hypothetical protein [Alteromonas australica]AIF97916.1 hypothetical protein EP13_03940 [Alteromonas australica]